MSSWCEPWPSLAIAHVDSAMSAAASKNESGTSTSSTRNCVPRESIRTASIEAVEQRPKLVRIQLVTRVHFDKAVCSFMLQQGDR